MVLSRKSNQPVYVQIAGLCLKVVVIEIRGERVRLGFEGPDEFSIERAELRDRPQPAAAG